MARRSIDDLADDEDDNVKPNRANNAKGPKPYRCGNISLDRLRSEIMLGILTNYIMAKERNRDLKEIEWYKILKSRVPEKINYDFRFKKDEFEKLTEKVEEADYDKRAAVLRKVVSKTGLNDVTKKMFSIEEDKTDPLYPFKGKNSYVLLYLTLRANKERLYGRLRKDFPGIVMG